MNLDKKILQQLINETINHFIPEEAWKSTIAIIIVRGKTLHPFATGTLLQVADEAFLVTAAHVIDSAHKQDLGLCVPDSKDLFIQIHGKWVRSSEGQYGTSGDPFDIAVLPLDSNIVEKLTDYSFIRFCDVSTEENLSKGIFCLCGYPALLSKASVDNNTVFTLKPFQFTTYVYEGSTDMLSEYQERFHLLLSAESSDVTDIKGRPFSFRDRDGNYAQFPSDLHGISGCSVWMIGDLSKPLTEWGKERSRIVAIQTGIYSKPPVIKTTRWIAVSTLLHEAFPELRPAIKLLHIE